MSYGNDYSNKPFERASKISHINIINDTAVQSFLSKCKIPPYHEKIDDKDIELHMLEEPTENPIKNIITVDGGYTNVFVKEDFPSSTIAFFGQTANLHKPMRELMTYLNQHHAIYLVGLEKSGSFVEHAVQASKKMLPKQMLLLGNSYIYKYIIPGNGRDNEPYASSSYYGHKLIFKSEHNNVYVAKIPNTQAMVEPQIDDYININEILYNITALKCDLYYNSLVPVVMANKLVSLAGHPSSDLLKDFAQEQLSQ